MESTDKPSTSTSSVVLTALSTRASPITSKRDLKKHDGGRGSRYNGAGRPMILLHSEELESQGTAMKREARRLNAGARTEEDLALGTQPKHRAMKSAPHRPS